MVLTHLILILNVIYVTGDCIGGLCSNNTCDWGFYNTTGDAPCEICNKLREQYHAENCCRQNSYVSTPHYNHLLANGSYQIVYTPPRDICQHLWVEWGKCPPICDNILPGEYCSWNIDCKETHQCLTSYCCVVKDTNCNSCANATGYCASCIEPMAFNVTGNLTCWYCPSYAYSSNNLCHTYTNCTSGWYMSFNGSVTSDRNCTEVPYGYYTNDTNVEVPVQWSTCTSGWASTLPNSTHDVQCSTHSVCTIDEFATPGNSTHDTVCFDRTICSPGTYVIDNGNTTADRVCSACDNGFTNASNLEACIAHGVCTAYEFIGNSTHDSVCV